MTAFGPERHAGREGRPVTDRVPPLGTVIEITMWIEVVSGIPSTGRDYLAERLRTCNEAVGPDVPPIHHL